MLCCFASQIIQDNACFAPKFRSTRVSSDPGTCYFTNRTLRAVLIVLRTKHFVVLKDQVCVPYLAPHWFYLCAKAQFLNVAARKYADRHVPLNDLCPILNENLD